MKVSVVIPCYNVSEFLPKLFDSIQRQQTQEGIEYIFVDDGSKDDTSLLLDDFCCKHVSAQVIHQQNTGVCGARNKGLEVARGDYVFFLDGDDYLTDNAAEVFIKVADDGADIVSFKNYIQKGGYDSPVQSSKVFTPSIPQGIYDVKSFLAFDEIVASASGLRLYRRQMLVDNRIVFDEDLPMGEMMTFFIHCLVHSKKIQMYDASVMVYLVRQNSISRSVNYDKDYKIFDAIERMQVYCDQFDQDLKNIKAIKRVVTSFSLGFTISKYAKNGLPWCAEIFRCFVKIKKSRYYQKCLRSAVCDNKVSKETRVLSLIVLMFPSKFTYNLIKTKRHS
jgi:glycosyltransferase involved in cell wall biosynthesis